MEQCRHYHDSIVVQGEAVGMACSSDRSDPVRKQASASRLRRTISLLALRLAQYLARALLTALSEKRHPEMVPKLRRAVAELKTRQLTLRGYRLGRGCRIFGLLDQVNPELVSIGDYSIIGAGSAVLTHCPIKGPQPVRIGNGVFVGYGAMILPGVSVGDGSVVGAGAIVTRDVAPRSIVAGNPARVIGSVSAEQVDQLLSRLKEGKALGEGRA